MMDENLKQRWAQLKAALEEKDVPQMALAAACGVSQATVSRVLWRCPKRNSQSFAKLCNYAFSETSRIQKSNPADNQHLMDALKSTWDGSPRHADALADILRAVNVATRIAKP
jgi:DNA-binding MurR/RpiR family transcriptional regulator